MSYNQPGSRRGKPKRVLDPAAGLTPPPSSSSQSNYYMYNQQVPMNNGMPPEFGFNVSDQGPPPNPPVYGFNAPHTQDYSTVPPKNERFSTPQFTPQILAEPIVTNMAMQYGNALVGSGKQHIEKYVPVTALKYYFAVDTDYVTMKLLLLFFPFTQKDWSVKYEQDVPLQPRYEKNAPDMYIPTMAFLTYIVMAGLALGTQERFTPEQLGILSSSALAWGIIELIVHTITLYVTNIETSLRTLDLLAYCSYKYVGINAALLASLIFRRVGYYVVLTYCSIALLFFLIKSLRLRMIPEGHSTYTAVGNKRRLYFILFIAVLQPCLMWCLSYHLL